MYSSLEDKKFQLSDSYTFYTPTKYKSPAHPSEVVEATSLSYVKSPPINYELKLLNSLKYKQGSLSCVQLECIALAHQKFEQYTPENYRCGFFLGDSAGLGKGRTIAGNFLENYLYNQKKGIWVTISQDLFTDCERDIEAVTKDKEYKSLNLVKIRPSFDFNIGRIPENAVICITYATLCRDGKKSKKGNSRSRFEHIIDWFSRYNDGSGLIVFDECHRGKGFVETRIGRVIQDLQNRLSNAKIIYSTATAASNPKDFVYMNRLGYWPIDSAVENNSAFVFKSPEDFVNEIEKRGISAMESLACELKASGSMISRLLSFKDVESLMLRVELDPSFIEMYNLSCQLWADLYSYLEKSDHKGKSKKLLSMFWSNNLNFFQSLVTSAKVELAASYGLERSSQHKNSVVYGLQKTGDSQYNILVKKKIKELSRSYSHSAAILLFVFENIFDVDLYHMFKNTANVDCKDIDDSESESTDEEESDATSSSEDNEFTHLTKHAKLEGLEQIIEQFKKLFYLLPSNAIDQLFNRLGGPANVSELTGRKTRSLYYGRNDVSNFPFARKKHTTDRESNIKEIENFQSGEKKFAIISDAASTGVSLHCERESKNTSKRCHVTLECAYSAEKFIQQLGRTHRSNQETAPLYVFILSSIPAEDRFLWGINDKLSKLGAITKGDRNSTQTFYEIEKVLDGHYGQIALKKLMSKINTGQITNEYKDFNLTEIQHWLTVLGVINCEKNTSKLGNKNQINRFMNRMLNIPICYQKQILDVFYNYLTEEIEKALKDKTYNSGVLEYKIPELAQVSILNEIEFHINNSELVYYAIQVDSGMKWDSLIEFGQNQLNPRFLVYTNSNSQILFAYTKNKVTHVIQPSNCDSVPLSTLSAMQFDRKKQRTINLVKNGNELEWPTEAKNLWNIQYDSMSSGYCIHRFTNQRCNILKCYAGARISFNGLLAGKLNGVWKLIEKQLELKHFPLVRVFSKSDKKKIVGVLLDNDAGEKLSVEFEKLST